MKKFLLLPILALAPALLSGQLNADRTANTKVSDALAMFPAKDAAMLEYAMEDLVSTGFEGMEILTGMFDDVNNVPVNYALNGLAFYVTGEGREDARKIYEQGIIYALGKATDTEVKRFYIDMLARTGAEVSLTVLWSMMQDDELGLPSITAITRIGIPAAGDLIKDAVTEGWGDRTALADAAGYLGVEGIYPVLESWLDGADDRLKEAVYYAMANGGDPRALAALGAAARAGNYSGPATLYYVDALKGMKDRENASVVKRAKELMSKAKANNDTSLGIAALETYILAGGKGYRDIVVKAMDDPDRVYRAGVLDLAAGFADDELYSGLLKKAAKTKNNEAKTDIIRFAGNSGDAAYTAEILPYLSFEGREVKYAAMEALTALGGADVPAALALQLAVASTREDADAVKTFLLACKGDVVSQVAEVAGDTGASVYGRVAALDILAAKRATGHAGLVFAVSEHPDLQVSSAACAALPYVVTQSDLPELFDRLERADAADVPYLQDAIASALDGMPSAYTTVTSRMDRAGEKSHLYFLPLASTGNPDALRIISESYKTGNPTVKSEAVRAMRSWNGPESAGHLYSVARDDNNPDALEGYIDAAVNSDLTPERKLIMLTTAAGIAKDNTTKIRIVDEAGKLHIFQSLIFVGGFLDNGDAVLRDRAAQSVMNITFSDSGWYGPVVTELLGKASVALDNPDAGYQREAIAKHLSELPQQGGFVSLFNGADLTGWKGIVANPIARATMSEAELARRQAAADELMLRNWTVEDGSIVYVGDGYDNICTEGQYGDFEMYIDWRVYPEDMEADGGLYLRGVPQVQIWRTDRADVGAEVGSGGLYNNQVHESKPLVVADNPTGEWNTFRIVMKGDRVSVWLNGDLVTDNTVLENYWNRKEPIFPVEQIELQGHTTRIGHRNIYIKELPRAEPYRVADDERAEGFTELFDGVSLDNWYGNTTDYVAEDSAIVLYPSKGSGGNLYTKEEFGDFVFRFEFMLTPGANNGIGIRTPDTGDAAYVGMEIQVLDDDAPIYSNLEHWQYHGSVYGIIAAERGHLKPMGEWNCQEIYADGNHIRVTLNGTVIVDGDIAEASQSGTLDGKDHPGLKNKQGHIAFLGHGSQVWFRNMRIKRLDR